MVPQVRRGEESGIAFKRMRNFKGLTEKKNFPVSDELDPDGGSPLLPTRCAPHENVANLNKVASPERARCVGSIEKAYGRL